MLVDDDQTMVGLLKTLLEMDGYEVINAQHQDRILQTISEEMPDLILLDVFLEEMDGLDLLGQIQEREALGEIHVIMSSGMDFSEQCHEAGADDFLLKPYSPERLVKAIENILGESKTDQQISSSQGVV
jgi:DNA-binding response OmpR family regulator